MSVYFCLDSVFEALSARPADDFGLNVFVPVQTTIPACNGHREDAMTLSSQPQLLDMNEELACYKMATLIDESPLYHDDLALVIDDILTQRLHNQKINAAITAAFGSRAFPERITDLYTEGALAHPALGLLDNVTLCKIYLDFMHALPHGHDQFSFERFITGNHTGPYYTRFDGFIFGEKGKVVADILLGFGVRSDYDPRLPLQGYIENGRRRATAMRLTEKTEILLAWLEADNYQMRRCLDIHRVLTLRGLPRMPNWVRTDAFHCMEREATKQVMARKILEEDPEMGIAAGKPNLLEALQANAREEINSDLKDLLDQVSSVGTPYKGAADRLHDRAKTREKEARTVPIRQV